jgi:hypothetical protein
MYNDVCTPAVISHDGLAALTNTSHPNLQSQNLFGPDYIVSREAVIELLTLFGTRSQPSAG